MAARHLLALTGAALATLIGVVVTGALAAAGVRDGVAITAGVAVFGGLVILAKLR